MGGEGERLVGGFNFDPFYYEHVLFFPLSYLMKWRNFGKNKERIINKHLCKITLWLI